MVESTRVNVATPLRGARVLVVEDDALLLMDLQAILVDAGAEVVGLRTVRDALSAVERNGAAAAVLDVRVGRDTVAPVAECLAKRGTPFLFYTGQVAGSDAVLREWPKCPVVSKPAGARDIVATIAGLLRS